eukprot:TRINITY_DN716_c0_g1_i1.p1 TRINITY_DN716_c0_g1~~TRINITY_DN716_c0_g1_i1.p1  ORF type:complete len:237 (-),score=-30.12 TRINITY_DN716_c0_g1_i1:32-742(-)
MVIRKSVWLSLSKVLISNIHNMNRQNLRGQIEVKKIIIQIKLKLILTLNPSSQLFTYYVRFFMLELWEHLNKLLTLLNDYTFFRLKHKNNTITDRLISLCKSQYLTLKTNKQINLYNYTINDRLIRSCKSQQLILKTNKQINLYNYKPTHMLVSICKKMQETPNQTVKKPHKRIHPLNYGSQRRYLIFVKIILIIYQNIYIYTTTRIQQSKTPQIRENNFDYVYLYYDKDIIIENT